MKGGAASKFKVMAGISFSGMPEAESYANIPGCRQQEMIEKLRVPARARAEVWGGHAVKTIKAGRLNCDGFIYGHQGHAPLVTLVRSGSGRTIPSFSNKSATRKSLLSRPMKHYCTHFRTAGIEELLVGDSMGW